MTAVLAGHYGRKKWANKKRSTCIVLWYNALFSFSLLELSMEGAWHRFVYPECISPPAVLLRSSAVGAGLNCLILDRLVAKLWNPELRRVVGLRLCSEMNWSPWAGPLSSTLLAVNQRGGLALLFLQCNVTWKWFPQNSSFAFNFSGTYWLCKATQTASK